MQGQTLCAQCDLPEDRCACEKYCTICKGQVNVRLCSDGLYYVPIAGKPVTSLWPAAVATEPKTFRLLLDADARLAAAAGGVARYLADAAGFQSDAVARLQSAVIAACLEAFEHLGGAHPQLEVTFTRFSDRMEVALSHLGEDSPAIGLDTIAGFASHIGATDLCGLFSPGSIAFSTKRTTEKASLA